MARQFMHKPIVKETVSLGVGGNIVRDDDFPSLPPRARVTFTAEADYAHVKHKFLEKGGVEETLILTIDASTFEVTDFSEPTEQPELPIPGEIPGPEADE